MREELLASAREWEGDERYRRYAEAMAGVVGDYIEPLMEDPLLATPDLMVSFAAAAWNASYLAREEQIAARNRVCEQLAGANPHALTHLYNLWTGLLERRKHNFGDIKVGIGAHEFYESKKGMRMRVVPVPLEDPPSADEASGEAPESPDAPPG
jgi:hypothetical protein